MSEPKQKKQKAPEFDHLLWTRIPGSEDYFDRADTLRSRFAKLTVIVVLLALLTPFLGYWVVQRARTPNPIQVFADGRLFSGEISYGTHVPNDILIRQCREVVEKLFIRTEAGGIAALDDFMAPGVKEVVENSFSLSRKMKSGYSQQYSITSTRTIVSSSSWVVIGLRGLLSSRTRDGYQVSEVFLLAGFLPGQKTDRNMLGWRLYRLGPDPEGETFYSKEISEERAKHFMEDK